MCSVLVQHGVGYPVPGSHSHSLLGVGVLQKKLQVLFSAAFRGTPVTKATEVRARVRAYSFGVCVHVCVLKCLPLGWRFYLACALTRGSHDPPTGPLDTHRIPKRRTQSRLSWRRDRWTGLHGVHRTPPHQSVQTCCHGGVSPQVLHCVHACPIFLRSTHRVSFINVLTPRGACALVLAWFSSSWRCVS